MRRDRSIPVERNSGGRLKKLRTAFILWMRGDFAVPEAKWRRQRAGRKEILAGSGVNALVVERRTIPDYNSPYFHEALMFWRNWRLIKLPLKDGGEDEQPCQWDDVITLFEATYNEYQAEEMESKRRH